MASGGDGPALGPIGELFGRGTVAGLGEGEILERFAAHRDGAAFEALVARHGPTVLGACRRFLRDPNDVEDAFQATFLILARKAAGLRDREALGPWLYGVACRVARRARAVAERRRRRESPDGPAIATAPAPETGRPDLAWLLDEEILRLPERLRLPVVLCLMEGRTYDEAASQLRWTPGMVRGRLAQARTRLQDRLIRRGEAPSVAMALVAMGAPSVPARLVASASRATLGAASGKSEGSTALALADWTLRRWIMIRIGSAALAMIAAGLVLGIGTAGLGPLARGPGRGEPALTRPDEPAKKPAVVKAAPAAKPKRRRGPVDSEVHPITIEGRALGRDGRAVAGASIVVTDANRSRPSGDDEVLGRGVSGPDGRFALRDLPLPVLQPDPGPIPRPAEGKFQVAGTAPGFGFTWHAVQSYRPTQKPADFQEPGPGLVAFAGEPVVSDLAFGPLSRVRGRVVDDRGRPVVGAKVQFGYIDSTRNPDGSGMWSCSAIDPKGGEGVAFNGIGSLPEAARSARTDADGRYEVVGLPREARMLALIDQDPTLEPFELTIATSASALPGVRSLGHDGVLDHTFVLPRKVPIRVTLADSGRPAAGVAVLAEVRTIRRAGAIATADAEGIATLALPPGDYPIRIEPPIGMPYRPSSGGAIRVRAMDAEAPRPFELAPAATVVLEAVDADTGQGLAGVGFVSATETSADRVEVHSQSTFVDHPTTDDAGKLRVVMDHGRRRFFPSQPPRGYDVMSSPSSVLTLDPGWTTTARFAFKKQPEPEVRPEEDEVGRRLRSTWEAQVRLLRRGRMRAGRTYQDGDSIPADRLRKLLGSLDPDKVPPLLDLIRATFPEAEPGSSGTYDIAVDGPRRRQEVVWANGSKKAADVTAYNGRETVSHRAVNSQVDIGDNGPKSGLRLAVAGFDDFCRWPTWGGKVVGRADGRVTLERKSGDHLTTIVADEATGFVYRETSGWTGTGSGEEHWQFAPRVAAGGAIIPGLSIDFTYQKDGLGAAWIKAIESIDLGAPVPPETFLVAVPPGTLILDYREGRGDNQRGLARRPITDVVAYADADPRRFKPFVPPVKPGDPAPAIDPIGWVDRGGKSAAPDLSGQVVLVDFWEIGCGPCVAQLPEVREAADHFAAKGLVLIGLHDSSGTPEKVAEFAARRDLTWTLAIDRPGDGFGATFTAYGVRSIPTAAVLDRQGRLAFLGDFRGALAKAASLLEEK
jgi:RNA polymerase sigma factor (sigma-70 family)